MGQVELNGQKVRPDGGGAVPPQQTPDDQPTYRLGQRKGQTAQGAEDQREDQVGTGAEVEAFGIEDTSGPRDVDGHQGDQVGGTLCFLVLK